MLKKAGIVVAAAAAGLLAVSPLAFAGDKGDHGHGHSDRHSDIENVNSASGDDIHGLIHVSGNNVDVPVQVLCNTDAPIQIGHHQSQVKDVTGALALFDSKAIAENSRECDNSGRAGDVSKQNIDD